LNEVSLHFLHVHSAEKSSVVSFSENYAYMAAMKTAQCYMLLQPCTCALLSMKWCSDGTWCWSITCIVYDTFITL